MKLRWYAKKLTAAKKLHSFGTDDKGVWIRPEEESRKQRVDVKEDLEPYAPSNVSLDDV